MCFREVLYSSFLFYQHSWEQPFLKRNKSLQKNIRDAKYYSNDIFWRRILFSRNFNLSNETNKAVINAFFIDIVPMVLELTNQMKRAHCWVNKKFKCDFVADFSLRIRRIPWPAKEINFHNWNRILVSQIWGSFWRFPHNYMEFLRAKLKYKTSSSNYTKEKFLQKKIGECFASDHIHKMSYHALVVLILLRKFCLWCVSQDQFRTFLTSSLGAPLTTVSYCLNQ